jgi:tetratricopeptide (TPR) repeat protein
MLGSLRSLLGRSAGGPARTRLTSWDIGKERAEGERLFELANYAGAELHLARAVQGERGHESADQRILLRLELGEAQRRQYESRGDSAKLAEAEGTVRAAFELAARGGDRELLTQTLDALLTIAAQMGDLNEAESLMLQLEALHAKLRRPDPLQRARRLHTVGLLLKKLGKVREAVDSLSESTSIHEKALGEEHPETAHQLSALGEAQHLLGHHKDAQRCLRRAMRIHEKHEGLDSPAAAANLRALTESLEATGDIEGAATEYERILTLKLRMMGQNPDGIAETQWELAHRYLDWGHNSRARELLLEAVSTFARTGGSRLAAGYEALAQLEEENGCFQEALRLRLRAGNVWESIRAEHMPQLIKNLERQAYLFDLLGQRREADLVRDQLTTQEAGPQ